MNWRAALLDAVTVLAVAALLLWPAFYNGYALLYPDSTLYVGLSFVPQEYPPRGLIYPLLMLPLHFGTTLWTVIAAQALLSAWVLRETIAVAAPRSRRLWLLGLGIVLAALTSLPWTVDQIMQDFFAGLLALAIALLTLFPERLSVPRRFVLLLIVAVGVAAHSSHAPLAIATLLVAAAINAWARLTLRSLLTPAAAILAGIGLTIAVNLVVTGHAYYSKGGEQFVFGRLLNDGIIADYLEEVCPRADLKLCELKERLPYNHNDYLWGDDEAFLLLGGWDSSPELRFIIFDSIKRMPLRHIWAVIDDTFRQLVQPRAGESLNRPSRGAASIIETAFPGDAVAFHRTVQQRDALRGFLQPLNSFQVPVQLAALALLPVLAFLLARRGERRLAGLCLLILAALAINAFICGVFSGVSDRYQSRIAWLAVAAVVALVAQQWHGGRLKTKSIAQ
ncbi:MAG: hypothetical protein ABI439_05635 [Rhodospirillales bacterium]